MPLKKTFTSTITRWWREDSETQVARALTQHAKMVETEQSSRILSYKKALRWYQGRDGLPGRARDAYLVAPNGQLLSLNVIASAIRTLRAKVVKNRPRPWIVTDGGTQAQQDSAQALQQFVEGCFSEYGVYEAMERAFDLSAICGDSWIKVYPDYEAARLRVEVSYPWEVLAGDQDAFYGRPRSLYQRAHMDREVLAEGYPDAADAIYLASPSAGDPDWGFAREGDQVEVWEGWRLPSSEKAKDGRHGLSCGDAPLSVGTWERSRFPFAHMTLEPEPVGFHGVGLAAELAGIQSEINETLTKIQEGHVTGGHVLLLVEAGSKVNKSKLTNALHGIVEYTGTPPTPVVIPAVSGETYNWVWTLLDKAYAIIGISQMAAQAQKPAGLVSGRALRTHHDIESERFSYMARAYERLCVDLAELVIDAATDLAEVVPGFTVRYRGPDSIKRIKWSEVSLDRDAFVMQTWPVSLLPQTPAGKLAAVQDLIDLQVIDGRAAKILMDLPDTKSLPDAYEASFKLARYQVDRILREGEAQTPEAFQDLNTALTVALDSYNRARTYPDVQAERLDLLRDYIEAIQGLLAPPPPPPEAMPPAAPAMPPDATVPAPPPMPQ